MSQNDSISVGEFARYTESLDQRLRDGFATVDRIEEKMIANATRLTVLETRQELLHDHAVGSARKWGSSVGIAAAVITEIVRGLMGASPHK